MPTLFAEGERMNAMAPERLVERLQQKDLYRRAVERQLGWWLAFAQGSDLERLHYVERCFDWGITPPTCARTWVAKVEAAPKVR
jgi:hypothetical protein